MHRGAPSDLSFDSPFPSLNVSLLPGWQRHLLQRVIFYIGPLAESLSSRFLRFYTSHTPFASGSPKFTS